ncbi:hypothetical protein HG536_0A04140 [Torulaspora globosa]|uniref:Maintenance of telomere capping protein 2 n=1 Tax=Torulaspora globosa TaxID=48254 RepID=A0A7G3ZAR0_9SACH|nr:uncharacterized protein HG536_0A04140 [Torulaspora globosa]QLL30596.1 hypothetical protein HG536_0A04140 [Torulaspora globosa]
MTEGKLPDLSTCLEFCLSAKKNLLFFYGKGPDKYGEIDVERQANAVKSLVEHRFSLNKITCRVTNQVAQRNEQQLSGTEICIFTGMETLDEHEQARLVQITAHNQNLVLIAMVPWESRIEDGARNLDADKTLRSSINLRDWLKHRFWLACYDLHRSHSIPSPIEIEDFKAIDAQVCCKHLIRRYILDIIVHIRMHRLLDITKGGGAHTGSLHDIEALAKLISYYKFAKKFVTPDHVKMACIWYFPLHLELVRNASMDISVLYGSRPDMVDGFLEKIAQLKVAQSNMAQNPLFLETLVVKDVLKKVVPPV